ncbi:MAG TPA: hypothetical protein VN829_11085, partial [Dongiaceae bacterium]|nr:hypothetical protein [Dongiaceae bacterium]
SVVGIRDEVSPYRVTGQRLLPKFGSDKSPPRLPKAVADRPGQRSTVNGAGNGGGAKPEVRSPKSEFRSAKWGKVGSGSGVGGGAKAPPPPAVAAAVSGGSRLGRAARRLASRIRAWFGRSECKPARRPTPRLGWSPIQEELRLDRVKVVRNDLRDSDLELVQLRPRIAAAKPKGVGVAKRVYSRLAGLRGLLGFFGAKRT